MGGQEKSVRPGFGALGGGVVDRFDAMALDEATRPITVREATRSQRYLRCRPIRTMFRAAAQGDTKAGRQLLEMIARAEMGGPGVALEFWSMLLYKEKYGPIFDERERRGEEPLDIYPHPDDIMIDKLHGEVTIDGPMSKEQAGAQKLFESKQFNPWGGISR